VRSQAFYLAAVSVASTPTANTVILLVELASGPQAKQAMSTAIFAQYLVAPLVLTITLTIIVGTLHVYG
jgi:hypothetical protein